MSFEDILRKPEPEPETAAETAARVVKGERRREPAVGGLPRVSLLPPEIRDAARVTVVRRVLIGSVAASVGAVLAGVLLAGAVAGASNDRLTAANDRTQGLAAQIAKFSDVARLDQQIAVGTAAAAVGSSTQIDWRAQYDAITADMPFGYSVESMTADSATVTTPYGQGDSPLERPRVATVVLSVDAPNTAQLPGWLRELRSIPAYADATASWADGSSSSGGSGVNITLTVHLDERALVNQQEAAK
ncbi:hypothetical protein [Amnibacterium endophyticum]|uniref:Fimbrial assembly protein n=1 Tax=Amnibacterium endophyticum TaxID=2109337 RepID=A0ABW4LDD9_9MICO